MSDTVNINDLRALLPAVAVEGTEKRRAAVTGILEAHGIPYELKMSRLYDGAPDPVNIEIDLTAYCDKPEAGLIILTAHYDAVTGSTGANDNGSSVSVLLKAADHIRQNKSRFPVKLLLFDQEEMMGRGSEAYFSEAGEEALYINLDVVGYGERIVFCDRSGGDPFIRELISRGKAEYGVMLAGRFPFSDADMIHSHGHPVLGISVFPEEDAKGLPERLGFSLIMDSKLDFNPESLCPHSLYLQLSFYVGAIVTLIGLLFKTYSARSFGDLFGGHVYHIKYIQH